MKVNAPLGVGFLGAGAVVQAIHLPTLARLADRLRVVHVMDPVLELAKAVAARTGAAYSTDMASLLADPAVDIVVIASPPAFHAEQALASVAAGKRGLLIEKPFAVTHEQAESVAAALHAAGTAVVVGTMHVFDPGWRSAIATYNEAMCQARFIRSTAILPPNAIFEDWATQIEHRRDPPPVRDLSLPAIRAAAVTAGTLGLAIHDLPLIRSVVPDWAEVEVLSAAPLAPLGYLINLRAGDRQIQLLAQSHRHRWFDWRLDFHGSAGTVTISFTPSYVNAGSASACCQVPSGLNAIPAQASNGYDAEWRHLHQLVTGKAAPLHFPEDFLDDTKFALRIAEGAGRAAQTGWLP